MARLMSSQNAGRDARAPQAGMPAPSALNLDYMNASTVMTDEFKFVQIVIAGCGGIGAYMAMHVGRLMRVLYNDQRGVNLTLVDPDTVEEKNLGRQLFCEAELGEPKALALARRYGGAWGLNTMAHVGEFEEQLLHTDADLIVLVGCVDNAAARNALNDTLGHNPESPAPHALPHIWWLDCGNLKDTGRVLLGSAYNREQCRGAFVWPNPQAARPSKCIALPSPALQYPGLLIPEREEVAGREMSCADLQMANLQSLNINAGIAVQAADMLTRLLVTRDLKRYQCAVNLASGSVKSYYCTPEEIAREIDRPVDFVVRGKARELAA
jgi:PRTRC genetic system ThiF family protein